MLGEVLRILEGILKKEKESVSFYKELRVLTADNPGTKHLLDEIYLDEVRHVKTVQKEIDALKLLKPA